MENPVRTGDGEVHHFLLFAQKSEHLLSQGFQDLP